MHSYENETKIITFLPKLFMQALNPLDGALPPQRFVINTTIGDFKDTESDEGVI